MWTLVVLFVMGLTFTFLLKRKKTSASNFESFAEEERKANMVRKKEIDPELLIKPDISKLPFHEVSKISETVKKQSSRPMIRFDKPMTNNDLKFMFGVANLEEITSMEENYAGFISEMIKWAESLIKENNFSDAATVLKETIRMKSDFVKSYTLLADIYKADNNLESLNALFDQVSDVGFLAEDLRSKNKIIKYIEERL